MQLKLTGVKSVGSQLNAGWFTVGRTIIGRCFCCGLFLAK
jgi:hypothetical protein